MDVVEILALTLGVGWASGINLYAAVLTLGLLGATGYAELPDGLAILENPMVLSAAGLMYCIEFFADKVPGLDSLWDAIHTFIRIPAAAVLASQAVGDVSAPAQLAAALVGGGLGAGSHFTKASGRALLNTSPEPVTNAVASLGEDAIVVAGMWAVLTHPLVALVLLAGIIALMVYLLPRIFAGLRATAGALRRMFGRSRGAGAACVALVLISGCRTTTIYEGGPVLTVDAENRIVEALAVRGDRIVAVGARTDVHAAAGRGAHVVNLNGRALLPGFIDAHGHFPGEGIFAVYANLNSPPIGSVRDFDEMVDALRATARNTRKGRWVVGMGYDDTLLPEGRHPTRRDLDRVSTDHPVAAWHISLHVVSLNSRALQELAIDRDRPAPDGGVIRKDGDGEPDGVLEETAVEWPRAAHGTPSGLDGVRVARAAQAAYLRAGVTTAQSGYTKPGLAKLLPWLSRTGVVDLRTVVWPEGDGEGDEALEAALASPWHDPRWMRFGALKLVADGSLQAYTGYLTRPYHVAAPGIDAKYRGYPRIEAGRLRDRVARIWARGRQVAVHGNGDASIDDILDAFEHAQRMHPRVDARPVIVHAQTARDDQLDRMRELGVVPSFFVLHTYYWGDRHYERFLGPDRASRISPARSADDRGLRFTLHADSPVVPMDALKISWSAVNRRTTGGRVLGADQRISPERALRAITIDAAFQHFEDKEKGSLEVGKLADMVILSRSPLEDPETIDQIEVLETIVGGRSLYRADCADCVD